MIKVEREAMPTILRQKAKRWLEDLRSSTAKTRNSKQNRYRHRQIKEALLRIFHGKCAYCESKITHVDYGHIEHYRPKSRWEDLTFEWDNLLLACGVCNGAAHKGNRFPEADEGGPVLDPCEDEPTNHLKFVYDKKTELASVYGISPRGNVTESLLGLNRNDLRAHRSLFMKKLDVIAEFAKNDLKAAELLERCMENDAEYAAFARVLLAGKL